MSKNRNRKQSENVSDRHTYTLFLRQELKCDRCSPHRGCNRLFKNRLGSNNICWKKLRTNQWKGGDNEC